VRWLLEAHDELVLSLGLDGHLAWRRGVYNKDRMRSRRARRVDYTTSREYETEIEGGGCASSSMLWGGGFDRFDGHLARRRVVRSSSMMPGGGSRDESEGSGLVVLPDIYIYIYIYIYTYIYMYICIYKYINF